MSFLSMLENLSNIEKLWNAFWWGGNRAANKGICWSSWDKLCGEGGCGEGSRGVGFRRLCPFNIALVAKPRDSSPILPP